MFLQTNTVLFHIWVSSLICSQNGISCLEVRVICFLIFVSELSVLVIVAGCLQFQLLMFPLFDEGVYWTCCCVKLSKSFSEPLRGISGNPEISKSKSFWVEAILFFFQTLKISYILLCVETQTPSCNKTNAWRWHGYPIWCSHSEWRWFSGN